MLNVFLLTAVDVKIKYLLSKKKKTKKIIWLIVIKFQRMKNKEKKIK